MTTEDFIGFCESESGLDLTDLFDAWLFQAELPPLPGRGVSTATAAT